MAFAKDKVLPHGLHETIMQMGKSAHKARRVLSSATTKSKNDAINATASALRRNQNKILDANSEDYAAARSAGMQASLTDRLVLNKDRLEAIACSLENIAKLEDPVGRLIDVRQRPNDLRIERIRVPLGVIGIIYEARPNVTADASSLCLKAGNAAILRGSSESYFSNFAIMDCLQEGLKEAGLPSACLQLVATRDRAAVGEMLIMDEYINLIVPRGGRKLIQRVKDETRIAVLAHLDGNCHTYIHKQADLETSRNIVHNAKLRRTSICGATESLLIDRDVLISHLPKVADDLINSGCEIRGDKEAQQIDARIRPAEENDWGTEYLDAIISVKVVADIEKAISHIEQFGSHHTDCIVTEDETAARRFLGEVDSAIVMHNTSTQFADGAEFGLGAEIGISTDRLHARGPVGLEELTIYKWVVHGKGQVRS